MNTNRNTAILAGVLFILAVVTSIIGVQLYKTILNDTDYIIKGSINETQVAWGMLLRV